MQWAVEGIISAGGYVFGRQTYDKFAEHWPNASEEERPLSEPLNTRRKYVATTTLREPLDWANSTVLQGDVSAALRDLKKSDEGDLHVHGSSRLVQQLLRDGVVDVLRLMIDPVVLGTGKRIFAEDGPRSSFRLAEHEVTTTGAILATYELADARRP
jgi:dihydrofolate reductase